MMIQALPSGPFATNAYVIGCPVTGQAAIIDPGVDSAEAVISTLTQHHLTPTKIILTHSHWDHIGDVAVLKEKYKIPVFIHRLDAPNLIEPGSDGLPMLHVIRGVTPDQCIEEGDHLAVGDLLFEVIHTPGHTPGGVCLYCEKDGVLLSGDTLFKQSIGNISFPTANPEAMWHSLKKLEKLPGKTRVFPGHGPSTTIGQESWLPRAREYFGGEY